MANGVITTPDEASEASLVVALRELHKGITASRDALVFETDADVLGDAICELTGLQTELDALRLQLVDQCRTNGVPQQAGVRTVGQYVAARTNNPAAGTNIDTAVNRWLFDFPTFRAALERRDMTMAHLRYIKKHLYNSRTYEQLRGDQEFLADVARDCSFDGFTKVCDYWQIAVDPDGDEPKDQLAKAGLTMRKGHGGRGHIEIDVDAASYAAIKKMLDHEVAKLKAECDSDQSEAAAELDPYTGTGIARQRLQALIGLATRGYQRDDGT